MIFLCALGGGFFLFWIFHRIKLGGFQTLGNQIIHRSEMEGEAMRSKMELQLQERELKHQEKLKREEQKLAEKKQELEERLKQTHLLEQVKKQVETLQEQTQSEHQKVLELKDLYQQKLEHTSSLSEQDAKALYMETIESEMGSYLLEKKASIEKECETEAGKILATTLGRLALPAVCEATVTTVELPSDEMKRRIIGREGRNVRLLEQLTGVNYLFDETPNAVVISSADPIRRSIAKHALKALISDGRIHASRIEEVVDRSTKEIERLGIAAAEKGALKVGVIDLHPELIALLGQLHFRYSMGQNLLDHSIEVSSVMRLIAAELKLDTQLAAKMGLLHDIGKAASHEEGLSHSLIGAKLALKYEQSAQVANGIAAHHGDEVPLTIEAQFVAIADTISAARPGARRENIERYIKRLHEMEKICLANRDVEKAYALQAGREVRVIVAPERVNDTQAAALARTLVKKLEQNVSFSGKIKVTVIREKKIIDYAS